MSPAPEQSTGWIEWVPIHETDFNDYVIVDPRGEAPAIYVFFQKEPLKGGEIDYYKNLNGRSREKMFNVDHIPSKAAIKEYLKETYPDMTDDEIKELYGDVASVTIKTKTHQKYSETFGGRNRSNIELEDGTIIKKAKFDSLDLYKVAESNWAAMREELKESEGYTEQEIDDMLQEVHRLNRAKGWYK